MGFADKSFDENSKGQRLLLDSSIYGKSGPPPELEGKLFQYSVVSVQLSAKEKSKPKLKCKYEDIVIKERGDERHSWTERGSDSSYLLLSMTSVQRGIELYMEHLGRVNKKLNDAKEEAKKKLSHDVNVKAHKPDFSDINVLVKRNPEKNIGRLLLELEFEFVRELPYKAKICGIEFDTKKQVWRHQIVSDVTAPV